MTARAAAQHQPMLPMKDITPPKAEKSKKAEAKAPAKKSHKVKAAKKAPSRAVAVHKPRRAPARAKTTNVLSIIAAAAADPNVQPDKMRALLDMQKEIMQEEQRMAFTAAYIRLQAELPPIRADGRIEIRKKDGSTGERTGDVQQSTPYATFPNIMRVIRPHLKAHGFTLSFATEPSADGRIIVKGFLDHISGHQRTTAFPLPAEASGSKNNVQAWGSAQAYGKRYGAIALLNLVTEAPEDRDDDGQAAGAPATVGMEQLQQLNDKLKATKTNTSKFCEYFGIKSVPDLPAVKFDAAMKILNQKAES